MSLAVQGMRWLSLDEFNADGKGSFATFSWYPRYADTGGKEQTEHDLNALGYFKGEARGTYYWELFNSIDATPDLKFPQLDTVLPLPPGKLGKWHGIEDAIGPEPDGPPSY